MDCGKIRGMLAAWLEGAVPPDQSRLVREHLSSCERCSRAAEELKKSGMLLKDLEEVEPPPWLTQKIMAHVREERGRKGGLLGRLFYPLHVKLPLQGVAAILIVGLAAFLYRAMEPRIETARAPLPREQAAQQQDRSASTQREETFARAPAPVATDARQQRQAPQEAASRNAATEQEQAYARKSMAAQAPAATAPRQAPPAPRPEDSQPAYAPLRSPDQTWTASPPGAPERPRLKAKAPAPHSAGVIAMKPDRVDLTVRVTDVADAAKKIEKLLDEQGASQVTRESKEGKEVISAEMKREQLKGLLQKLSVLGETRGSAGDVTAGEAVAVRIDLQETAKADEAIR